MPNTEYLLTAESVSEGHPDKIADQLSDAVLDAILSKDPHARVACETMVSTGLVLFGGQITTNAWIDFESLARATIQKIGYTRAEYGLDATSCAVMSAIGRQSSDIARGVDRKEQAEQGAGDQGTMFGYACNETDVLMPAPITYAHRLMQRQASLRKTGKLYWLRPDAKSQVTFLYENGKPQHITNIVLSTQHDPAIEYEQLQEAVIEEIIKPVIPSHLLKKTTYYINPTGRFVIGGPQGDCGLTGRKIMVDSYGSVAHHGGGCYSGKDPSKVDRSAAYAARYVAKNLVAAGLVERCEFQLSYAIGVAEPTAMNIQTFGTGTRSDAALLDLVKQHFDLRPYGIITMLNLLRPIYEQTAAYGHFGRTDIQLPWEQTDKAALLR